ncbi:MAG: chromate transporter [Dehalococcoidia bacterium]
MNESPSRVRLSSLIGAFGTIGLTSFGGGRAAYFRHAIVAQRHWLNDEQFLEGLTLSQILPGPNVSNLSVYLGQRLRGSMGAAPAVGAVVLPGAAMILLLAVLYFQHGSIPRAPAVFKGVGAAAVGLALATTLQVGRRGLLCRLDLVFAAATFAAVVFLHLSLIVVLLTLAPVSVWANRPRRRMRPLDPGGSREAQQ